MELRTLLVAVSRLGQCRRPLRMSGLCRHSARLKPPQWSDVLYAEVPTTMYPVWPKSAVPWIEQNRG